MYLPDLTVYTRNGFPQPVAISIDGQKSWIDPASVAEGTVFDVGFSLINGGYDYASNIDVEVTINGEPLREKKIEHLDAGYANWFFYSPTALNPGKYEITMTIDPENKIAELDETNNTFTYSFTVNGNTDWMLKTDWSSNNELFGTDTTINSFAPIDQKTGERCVAGCANVAISQIIYYYAKKGYKFNLDLTGEDAYVTDDNLVIDGTEKNAVANGNLSFAEINKILASFDPDSATDVAALCYASGVMTKSNFSSTETSTYGTVKDIFIRVGFESAFSATKNQGSDFWNGNNLSDKGWNKIVSNMENNRPIFASIPNPGHVVVIDGYDAETKKVHINYGWGILNGKRYRSEYGLVEGSGWYTRSECNSLGVRELIYDIIPGSPKDLQLTELSTTTSPTTADNMVLYFTIKNNGPNASGASKAYIYENNVKIGELSVDSLAAGESRKCSYKFAAGKFTAGLHTFRVIADGGNVVNETSETNNSRSRSIYINQATQDLQLSALTYARNTSANTVKLNFTIKNNGNGTSGASKAYIYDGTKKLATVSVAAIAAKSSKTYSYTLNTGNLATGTHKFKVVADGANTVKENNESNNALTKSVSVSRDLQLSALTYARSSSANTVKLNFTIKNNGNAASGAYKTYLYDGTKKLATFSFASFAAGVSKSYSYTLNAANLATGTHKFKVTADGANTVKENNESNNALTKSVSVSRDLQLSALTYARSSSANTVKLNFTIKNNGNAASGAYKTYLYDGTKKLATFSFASFAAGVSKSYSYTLNAANLATGTHKFKVTADGANTVKETNEKNNYLTKSVSVSRDLQLSALTYARSSSANTVKLNFTIKNNGNAASGASKAYVYDGTKKLATLSIASVAAGVSKSYSYTINAGNLAIGTHNFKVVADGANTVKETNEKNNYLTKSVSVTRKLQVSNYTATASSENVKLSFTIKNTGNTRVGASKAYIYDGTKKLVTLSLASFNGNSGRNFSYTFAAGKLSAGTHNLKVVTTHSSSTLAVKVAGVKNSSYGGTAPGTLGSPEPESITRYGNITGSTFSDTITFTANRRRETGKISLGAGNDKITAANAGLQMNESVIESGSVYMGSGNDTISLGANTDFETKLVDTGSGSDTISIHGKFAEADFDVIKTGDGNDTITIAAGAFMENTSFDLGSGADSFTVNGNLVLFSFGDFSTSAFGSGDDVFTIGSGGVVLLDSYHNKLDFGPGNDSLHINGVLRLTSPEKAVSNVENVSGSGVVAVNLTGSPNIDWIDDLLNGSGVDIVNDMGLNGFQGKNRELNDNSIGGSSVQNLTSQGNIDEIDFWLCGSGKAASIDHGFADSADFIKYTKNSADQSVEIWEINSPDYYGSPDDILNVDVFDANGNQLTGSKYDFMASVDSLEADVSSWKNGTYYLKLSTASSKAVSGSIEIDCD
ncbi:MAG: hypothetical protein E7050_00985 [Lentisphaerae bacterium]|nr:hypothetical protein [Lentisphaerota bacterium]